MTALTQEDRACLDGTPEEQRYQSVCAFAHQAGPEQLRPLMAAVADASYRIREAALDALGSYESSDILPLLEVQLRDHGDANLRNAAIEVLPRLGEAAVLHLLPMLHDEDHEVRMFTAQVLGDLALPSATQGLMQALDDDDENVRHAAAAALGKTGDAQAVPSLVRCLDEDFWVQYPAVVSLGQIRDPAATAHLVPLLDDEMLRQPVVEAMGEIGDYAAVEPLSALLRSSDLSHRNDVIAALVQIQSTLEQQAAPDRNCLPSIRQSLQTHDLVDHLLGSLEDPKLEVKKNAVIALGWLREPRATEPLVDLLGDFELEEFAVGSLAAIGDQALPALTQALEYSNPKVRIAALRCLGWLEAGEAFEQCIALIDDVNFEVRYQAVVTLGEGLDRPAVQDALLALLGSEETELRSTALEMLRQAPADDLAPRLMVMLTEAAPGPRAASAELLGRLGIVAACEPLDGLLIHQNDNLRATALAALHRLRPDGETPRQMLDALEDPSPVVRRIAAECLSEVPNVAVQERLIALLDEEDLEVRLIATETLARAGTEACLDALIAQYEQADQRLRRALLSALGHIGGRASLDFLINVLRSSDTSLKRTALDGLARLADSRALPAVVIVLEEEDWGVRSAAVKALGAIGDQRGLRPLLNRLRDPDDIVRKHAIGALARLGDPSATESILPLVHNENLQLEVLQAVEQLGLVELDSFFDFLKRSNTRLRCRLVALLGRLRPNNALAHVISLLETDFFTVRAAAARCLGELGDEKAIPSLLVARKEDPSDEVRREAARSLRSLDRQS